MPTGVAIRDAREQLFNAAERVVLRDGPGALTSRAVTTEADCAKGVLHRHFADFDAFLAAFVLERVVAPGGRAAADLRGVAGTGTVAGNLAGALADLLNPLAMAAMGLAIARDGLRARLREAGASGLAVAAEAAAAVAGYLAAERELGRIAVGTDIDTLAPTLVGAAHLLFADREADPPDPAAVRGMVATVVAGAVAEPPPP
ncbi:TetR/AcrR family transcriptional regulator [Streptomonospora sediminis]